MRSAIKEKLLIAVLLDFAKDLFKAFPRPVVINVLLQFCLGLTQGIGLLMLLPLLAFVGLLPTTGAMSPPPAFSEYFNQLSLVTILLIFCIVIFIHALVRRSQSILTVDIENNYANLTRTRLYKALCQSGWLFLGNQKSADLTHTLTIEVQRTSHMVKLSFELVSTLLLSAVYVAVGLLLHPGLLLTALSCGLLLFVLLRSYTREANLHGIKSQHHMKQMFTDIIDLFSGMKTIKSQAKESDMQVRFSQSCDELALSHKRFARANSSTAMFHEMGAVIFIVVVVYFAIEVLQVNSTVLLILLLTFARLMPRLSLILRLMQQLLNHLPAFDAICKLHHQCRENAEEDYKKGAQQKVELKKQIQLDNVSYQNGERQSLRSINITIPVQSTIALVGRSGAGKTTLADIIAGLSVPSDGQVLLDAVPLNADNRLLWRRSISYVTQEPFLFHDTIRANLLWLNTDATEQDLWQALELAAAKVFVEALPLGLETILGDRGMNLSGGEKQRVALARALINHPDLLILDEATSALDVENERLIQQALEHLHGKMTIVLIAHRLSTIQNADQIYVLDRGAVIQSGQWHELSGNKQGLFASLLQLDGSIDLNSR
jgi:ATP-binding cassette subfamily C protein